jgi:CRISPR-associated protein Csm5
MGLYKKIDYPLHARSVGERPLYRECIRPYVSVDFTITFDSNIVEEKGIDIKYILEAFDEFTKDWHDLLKVFDDDLDRANIYMPSDEEDYKANFCIGGGSGFLTKTVFYTIFDDKKEALELVRKYLDIAFKSIHKHIQKDKEISPRTLKLAKDRGDYINIGWCNIQEVKI